MRSIYAISLILVVIGALNWGLVGLFGFNLVAAIFGELTPLTRLIYILVGIAGVIAAVMAASQTPARTAPRREHVA